MQDEKNYDFLKRMREVHKADRRDRSRTPSEGEFEVDSSWRIVIGSSAPKLVRHAANDFQDYLLKSMNVSVRIETASELKKTPKTLLFVTAAEYQGIPLETPRKQGSFVLEALIYICL